MKKPRTFILSEEQIKKIIGEDWENSEGVDVMANDGSSQVYASDKPSDKLPDPMITDKLKLTNDMGMLWKNGGVTFSAVKESCKKKELTERNKFIDNFNKKITLSPDEKKKLANEREGSLAYQAAKGTINADRLGYTLSRYAENPNLMSADAAKILGDKYTEIKKQAKNWRDTNPEGQKLNVTRDGSKGGAHSLKPNSNGVTRIEA